VQFRDVEAQIVDRGFEQGWIQPQPPKAKTGRTVAIVGSGPAGLAAAQQLARAGHQVVVYEKDVAPGGLLRYGIPPFRLDKALLDRRLEQLKAEGVVFKTGTRIGEGLPASELRRQYDAVLLAVGASKPRDLAVAGRELKGIHYAIDFLRQGQGNGSTNGTFDVKGKTVVVIGGGLTGEDCVETALLGGAVRVHQLEILPKGPEKAGGHVVEDDDRVSRRYCVSTQRFVPGQAGRVGSLHAAQVQWVPSAKGPVMQTVPESEFQLDADLVLLAVGFDPLPDEAIVQQMELPIDDRGRLVARELVVSNSGVFVAGDLANGASYVATAIDSGRQAAAKIETYLARKQQQ